MGKIVLSAGARRRRLAKRLVLFLVVVAVVVVAAVWLDIPGRFTSRTVTYSVSVNGSVDTSLKKFSTEVGDTLHGRKGWQQAGLRFKEVSDGGDLQIVLVNSGLMSSYSEGCSAKWNCRVGKYVLVNDARWEGASDAWNSAGLSLADYRSMTINHEVGHFLGHLDNERTCDKPGDPAPVMQQQSIDLQGCAFNAWPLPSELTYQLP
jgi:hypothetical protein